MAVSAQGMGPGRPDPGMMPEQTRSDDGTVWVKTDIITIMANNEVPQFHFWYTTDTDGQLAKFMTSYIMIAEFEDSNGDGAFQSNESLYSAPLASYEWSLTTGTVEDDGVTTEVWLKYTKSGVRTIPIPDVPIPMPPFNDSSSVHRFEDVTIQIWAHIYLYDYYGEVTDDHGAQVNFTVAGRSELKMDIEIGNFPFSSETSMVTLETLQRENVAPGDPNMMRHRIQTRERFRNVTFDSSMNWSTTGGNESRFERMNGTAIQRLDFVDSETAMAQGFFSWLDKATITWPGGDTELVTVNASYVPTGMGVAVYLSYPNFDGGSILHDPSIGLYPDAAPLPPLSLDSPLVLGIGAVVIGAILIVLVKKR
ncbi:MAG: hypothetical protein ACTSV3_02135 [Candidatus Thorarchaeota archaeon]|nr:MAG: hypothetical protein DRP09_12050 [Candidatus Thorarchaeota archaeon]